MFVPPFGCHGETEGRPIEWSARDRERRFFPASLPPRGTEATGRSSGDSPPTNGPSRRLSVHSLRTHRLRAAPAVSGGTATDACHNRFVEHLAGLSCPQNTACEGRLLSCFVAILRASSRKSPTSPVLTCPRSTGVIGLVPASRQIHSIGVELLGWGAVPSDKRSVRLRGPPFPRRAPALRSAGGCSGSLHPRGRRGCDWPVSYSRGSAAFADVPLQPSRAIHSSSLPKVTRRGRGPRAVSGSRESPG